MSNQQLQNFKNRTNLQTGLSNEQVKKFPKNQIQKLPEKSIIQMLKEQIFTFFTILNLALAIVLIVIGEAKNALFIGVALINVIIGFSQELKARKLLAQLKILNEPQVTVIRNSKKQQILSDQLVENDIIELISGSQITIDGVIVQGAIEVDESTLTGESKLILKSKKSFIYSGAQVMTGRCLVQVVNVAEKTYINQLTKQVKQVVKNDSELVKSINQIIKFLTIIIIPFIIIMLWTNFNIINGTFNLKQIIVTLVASIIGIIPEGLVLLTSVAFASGIIKLSKQKALVQELTAIESLARVNTLCLDKTGTLTTGKMKVMQILKTSPDFEIEKFNNFCQLSQDQNFTIKCLKQYFKDHSNILETPIGEVIRIINFSSEKKYSGLITKSGTYLLGAPENLLTNANPNIIEFINKQQDLGLRVLVFIKKSDESKTNNNVQAVIVLADELRKNVFKTLNYLNEQKINFKIISGDNVRTLQSIAKQLNLPNSNRVIDGKLLSINDSDYDQKVASTQIFGRISTKQKAQIVASLQKQGYFVGMIGDGVNDLLALKKANCSISLGNSTQAAKSIAKIILLDENFENIGRIIKEGRRVVNNIEKVASIFLVKTVYTLLVTLIVVIIQRQNYPFYPIHMTFLASMLIGIPSLIITLTPNNEPVQKGFYMRIIKISILSGIAITITILIIRQLTMSEPYELVATKTLAAIGIVHCTIIAHIAKPLTKFKKLIILLAIIIFVTSFKLPIIIKMFDLAPLSNLELLSSIVIGAISACCLMISLNIKSGRL